MSQSSTKSMCYSYRYIRDLQLGYDSTLYRYIKAVQQGQGYIV